MFAPVYYVQPVYMQPAYVFTPSITIAAPGLMANMFVQPNYSHYCFGDYYDRTFISVGIVPWFSFTYVSGPGRPVYNDPLFAFYVSVNVGRDPGWVTRVQRQYIVCRDNVAMRPPRTYVEQTRIIERNVTVVNNGRGGGDALMAMPLHQLASRAGTAGGMRLERVSAEARQQWQQRGVALQQLRNERSIQERRTASERAAGNGAGRGLARAQTRPRPLTLSPSPVAAPIHAHGAAGESIGPMGHSEHQLSDPEGRTTFRTQLRTRRASGGQAARFRGVSRALHSARGCRRKVGARASLWERTGCAPRRHPRVRHGLRAHRRRA